MLADFYWCHLKFSMWQHRYLNLEAVFLQVNIKEAESENCFWGHVSKVAYFTFAQFYWPEFNHMLHIAVREDEGIISSSKTICPAKIKVNEEREEEKEKCKNTKEFLSHCTYVDNRLLLIFKFHFKINIFMVLPEVYFTIYWNISNH